MTTLSIRVRDYRRPLWARTPWIVRSAQIVAACAVGGFVLTSLATARIDAQRARQAMCVAKYEAWRARNPLLAKGTMRGPLANTCADYTLLTGETIR